MTAGGMKVNKSGRVVYLTFPGFEKYGFVRHAFSTRAGGVSGGVFSSMNLSFGRGDDEKNVMENYRIFCKAAGFGFETLVASSQKHGTSIRRVGKENAGTGIFKPQDMESADGLITDEPGVTLVTYYADCVPLYLIDVKKHAVGLVHAGWRGTAAKIGAEAVAAMAREFGSRPCDMAAAVGPSIGPCCFEVDKPVRDVFASVGGIGSPDGFIKEGRNGKYHINLWEANRRILKEAGIPDSSIAVSGVCTKCGQDVFFSHRAMGAARGGMAAFMEIKEENDGN
jgi:hypothetical protein